MNNGLVIYEKEKCSKCQATKVFAKQAGVEFEVRQIFNEDGGFSAEPETIMDKFDFKEAPIVVAYKDGQPVKHWSGFQMNLIKQYG